MEQAQQQVAAAQQRTAALEALLARSQMSTDAPPAVVTVHYAVQRWRKWVATTCS